jgi:pSer/pThr/pTyr-binding forkhead associated (FHA) protein
MLPQALADTAVTTPRADSKVSLAAPFAGATAETSLSGTELSHAPTPAGPMLVPLNGGPNILLTKSQVVMGRDFECDIPISSGLVSGRHCELQFDGVHWRVLDLGSKNGVQVNGRPASDEILQPGDRLSLACQHHYQIEYVVEIPVISPRTTRWAVIGTAAGLIAAAALYALARWLSR